MVNVKVGLFDRYVLKPLWVIYIVLFVRYFIDGAWLLGGFLVLMWHLISVIGQALHPNMTVAEMSRGTTPSKRELNNDQNPDEITDIEAVLISRAVYRIALLNGITVIGILWFNSMRWYYIGLIGAGTFLLSLVIIPIYSLVLIGRKMKTK